MNHEYKNNFKDVVLNNPIFIKKIKSAFDKMQNDEAIFTQTPDYKSYLYIQDNLGYILINENEFISVYKAEKMYGEKEYFSAFKKGDRESLKYHGEKIIAIFNSEQSTQESQKQINKHLKIYGDNIRMKEYAMEQLAYSNTIKIQSATSNPYEFKLFFKLLESNNFSKPFDTDFLYDNPELYKKLASRVPEFSIVLKATYDALKTNNITEKNKFIYNDLDNKIWKNAQYIISIEQNFSWVTEYKDKKNFTVYAALDESNGIGSKYQTLNKLLKAVKSGEALDDIDCVGLRVRDGVVAYANNAFINNLDFNIMMNKEVLESDGLLNVSYGEIDTKSFEYQFAYYNTHSKYSKTQFLIHTLFVLGNGFTYDSEKGRFYDTVPFVPGLLENFKYEDKKETLSSMMFLCPAKIEYLDDQWLDALKTILNKIKEDKPDLSKTTVSYNIFSASEEKITPEKVLEKLDNVVKENEKMRLNKKNHI